jgi:hypothetical protein
VRIAQLVAGIDVSVVGCPAVVHPNTCGVWQGSGGVDAGGAAFGMTGDQGVLVGASAVHPMGAAREPQPGLVEPGDLRCGDSLTHGLAELIEPACGAFGHRRDGAIRDRGAEQLGQRLGWALLGQELSHLTSSPH